MQYTVRNDKFRMGGKICLFTKNMRRKKKRKKVECLVIFGRNDACEWL